MTQWQEHKTGSICWLEREGTGTPIVLLHGIGSNARSFTPLVPHLPANARLIAWNAPGYGGSTPMDIDWPVAADYADTLAGFLDAIALPKALIVGHSLGCLMGAAFAAIHPQRVLRIIFASPALGHGITPGAPLSDGAQARIDELTELGPAGFAAARAQRLVWQPEVHADVTAWVQNGMSQVSMPGYGQAARMLASGRLLADAAKLSVNADVIVGDEDVITPPEAAKRLHDHLPTAIRGRLDGIPAAGHALYQQAPASFASALRLNTPEGV